MATSSAYAKSAVDALSQVLHLPPGGSDAENAAIIIIEAAIRKAARTHEH